MLILKTNIRDLRNRLRKVQKELNGAYLDVAILQSEVTGLRALKKHAPKSKRGESTGMHLKDSFFTKRVKKFTVNFHSKVEYAQMVNDGTKPSRGGYIPKLKRRLTVRGLARGNFKSKKLTTHPGMKGTKYIDKAADEVEQKLVKRVIRSLERAGFIKRGEIRI